MPAAAGHQAQCKSAPAKCLFQQARPPTQPAGIRDAQQRQDRDYGQKKYQDTGNFHAVGHKLTDKFLVPGNWGRRFFPRAAG